jgi:UDP-N-acetylmuramoyl-L-alanyl-D-glutamate--2,6-diaminopimelate ligase
MNALANNSNGTHRPTLRELLRGLVSDAVLMQVPLQPVTALTLDSRNVQTGGVFLALPGLQRHGLDYAVQALANDASIVLWEPTPDRVASSLTGAHLVAIPQLSTIVGQLADRFYAQPSAALNIAAVTGTNGKSTTAYLIAEAAESCGIAAGYSGTVGYGRVSELKPATHTTPDALSVHRQLAELRDLGARAVGIEVSSHALHQHRIAAVRIDTAVFTNLSRDHLDYHGSMQAYGEAKALLFQTPRLRHRVINADDAFGRELLETSSTATATTAFSCAAAFSAPRVLRAREVRLSVAGIELEITGSFGEAQLRSSLLGRFNAENLLATLAVLLGWDISLTRAVEALEQAAAPPGRMEVHRDASGKLAVIDYAHTPDALEKALQVLKAHCRGNLICVFGCGGDRDPGKRPQMGAAAQRWSDHIILTNDNPRSEDPQQIISDIQAGMAASADVRVEMDRAKAIERALELAQAQDIVLIAGKGHEDYQLIGISKHHFSDREVVQAYMRRVV